MQREQDLGCRVRSRAESAPCRFQISEVQCFEFSIGIENADIEMVLRLVSSSVAPKPQSDYSNILGPRSIFLKLVLHPHRKFCLIPIDS
jgi:hypothetical protein